MGCPPLPLLPASAPGDGGGVAVRGGLEAAGRVTLLEFDAEVRQLGERLEIEAIATVDPRELGMSSGMLGMIRPPATLHVVARLTSTVGA